ncbi:MAG TPA: tetratricopeptide repeat protein [Candidatus Manganitrophaceae bacterium]|nr:tetratricopeptide repeat protein [Candidatus Manganitrophaceae bacterium]
MAEKELSPEIQKLMDKITKDPASRLFVPLAEEYVKCEMVDEAILVLVDGIKRHSTYLAGRVLLGKLYLQKKQVPEAKAEFEQAIQINPENILAQKKLALIYQGEGERSKAIEACKKILTIDPTDKETKSLLSTLEKGGSAPLSAQEEGETAVSPSEPASPPLLPEAPPSHPSSMEAPGALSDAIDPEEAAGSSDETVVYQGGEREAKGGPSGSVSGDGVLSTTLASLYMSQGHYDKAIDVYKKLLTRDPSDEESAAGLRKATEKWAALAKGAPSTESPGGAEKSKPRAGKAQRLQAWLDSIRKEERR